MSPDSQQWPTTTYLCVQERGGVDVDGDYGDYACGDDDEHVVVSLELIAVITCKMQN